MGSGRVAVIVLIGLTAVAACDASYRALGTDADAGGDATATADASANGIADGTTSSGNGDASGDAGAQEETGSGDASLCDAANDPNNCGTCGRICNVGGCVAGECEHLGFTILPNVAPNLGGLAGADKLCNDTALTAGFHGHFLAWLGTPAAAPATRFFKATRPYVQAGTGNVIATSFATLISGSLMHEVGINVDGGNVGTGLVWSNVADDGTYTAGDGNACAGWTSSSSLDRGLTGNASGTGGGWTNNGSDACNTTGRGVYCFEQ